MTGSWRAVAFGSLVVALIFTGVNTAQWIRGGRRRLRTFLSPASPSQFASVCRAYPFRTSDAFSTRGSADRGRLPVPSTTLRPAVFFTETYNVDVKDIAILDARLGVQPTYPRPSTPKGAQRTLRA